VVVSNLYVLFKLARTSVGLTFISACPAAVKIGVPPQCARPMELSECIAATRVFIALVVCDRASSITVAQLFRPASGIARTALRQGSPDDSAVFVHRSSLAALSAEDSRHFGTEQEHAGGSAQIFFGPLTNKVRALLSFTNS
jgi:hypothetical protein